MNARSLLRPKSLARAPNGGTPGDLSSGDSRPGSAGRVRNPPGVQRPIARARRSRFVRLTSDEDSFGEPRGRA
eukprot:8152154-Lingulodinium_polyedra.AAC.1